MNPPEKTQCQNVGDGATANRCDGANFAFDRDTFAFANETKWRYSVDPATGRQVSTPRVPPPDYTLHCFVLARAARQFHLHARFDPTLPAPDEDACRRLIRAVISRSTQKASPATEKIVIPGHTGLREFSAARESLLKAECGGAWRSYFQRGNWRTVLPFSCGHQAREAARLLANLRRGELPIIHAVRFPQLTINHALLLFQAIEDSTTITFNAYDPNLPNAPVAVVFARASRTFSLPPLAYFAGGRVDIYEIYRGWIY